MRAVAAELASRGLGLLDAPVGGSVGPARQRQLTVLGGGEQADFAEFAPLLDAVAAKTVVFGPVGAGSAVKLVVNSILITAVAGAAEALTWLARTEPEAEVCRAAADGGLANHDLAGLGTQARTRGSG